MILYITDKGLNNLGAKMHLESIKEIFNDIYILDLSFNKEHLNESKVISFGKYKSKKERLIRMVQGNAVCLSNKIINQICDIVKKNNIDLIIFEGSIFGNLIKKIKNKFLSIKIVTFFIDINADLYRQWIKHVSLIRKIDSIIGIKQEKITVKYSDYNIVFHNNDKKLFMHYYKKNPNFILPLYTNIPIFNHKIDLNNFSHKEILFIGRKYFPNLIGIKWFYNNVWPYISSNYILKIVGSGLENLKNDFIDDRINVLGKVENIENYYLNADIVIAPLFDGGGMKTKVLEALSYGKFLIGTNESMHGFWENLSDNVKNRLIFNFDSPKEWINLFKKLDNIEIKKFNQEIFDEFIKTFSFEVGTEKLKDIFNQILESKI